MRILPFLLLTLLLLHPFQTTGTDVQAIVALSVSDDQVYVGECFVVAVFVNVTVLFNETPTDLWNGTISLNVSIKVPEGLNVTDLSYGEVRNSTIVAYRQNATEALFYVTMNATAVGDYTLSAVVELNVSITARLENETPAYLNDTRTITSNFVTVHVTEKPTESAEERNRISATEAIKDRYLQLLLLLMVLGFVISNYLSDLKARRRSAKKRGVFDKNDSFRNHGHSWHSA